MRREEKSFGVPHPHVSSLAYNCLTLRTNGKTPRYETMYVEYGLVPWAPLMQMLQTAMHSIQARAAQCCRLTWISPIWFGNGRLGMMGMLFGSRKSFKGWILRLSLYVISDQASFPSTLSLSLEIFSHGGVMAYDIAWDKT
ncbi:hypothetical protein HKD37_08G022216 [Glycine soja]|nr:hypothetical protein D0Y65_020952 [Glycine soja]